MTVLRKLIREFLLVEMKGDADEKNNDKLLTEPDGVDDNDSGSEETDEQSVVANIAGVTTPLGTGPTYPNKPRKKKKKPKFSDFGGGQSDV
tara:strand:+ start:11468 stop:11740 length:273 start_codon:yes stop_codon:yes gene_type:complete